MYSQDSDQINGFNGLSRQGNQRVRIKKVYHVIKNKEVPSHHEFNHRYSNDYCPECVAMNNNNNNNYLSVQPAVQYVPSPRITQIAPAPIAQFTPPSFASRIPLPEAPALPVYTPPTGFDIAINRNEASHTPNTVNYEPESYNHYEPNVNKLNVNFFFLVYFIT